MRIETGCLSALAVGILTPASCRLSIWLIRAHQNAALRVTLEAALTCRLPLASPHKFAPARRSNTHGLLPS
jgi:hypothetical protein